MELTPVMMSKYSEFKNMPTLPIKKSLMEVLQNMPDVGSDADFERVQDDTAAPEIFEPERTSIEAFQNGDLSLGQLGKILNKNQYETIRLLDSLDIPVVDYDLAEDMEAIDRLLKGKQ